jgi:NAD(P)H-hydrate epimerase
MQAVLSREQAQAFDAYASETWRVPSLLLMENAGRSATEIIKRATAPAARVLVVTGAGNNAGDGFVVARRLLVEGMQVQVAALSSPSLLKGDARVNCEAFVAIGGELVDCSTPEQSSAFEAALHSSDCVVDAIFGIGLDREITGAFKRAIERINRARAEGHLSRIIALDLPSGLEANRGAILGAAVRADITVCFAHHKIGHLSPNGADYCGELRLVDIGVPSRVPDVIGQSMMLLEAKDVRPLCPARPLSSHKNSVGRVVVIAGSPGKAGAALLVGQAALRAGAGVVTLAGFEETTQLLDRRVQELMTARIDRSRIEVGVQELCADVDAVVIGPGLGLDDAAARLIIAATRAGKPMVMDADALTHFAGRLSEIAAISGPLVLTPHPGELGRLLGSSSQQIEADRLRAVSQAATTANATVLLKGPYTIVASPNQVPVIHAAHAPVLATAGSGDVLAGILGAFLTRLTPQNAALLAAFVHARSAEAWQQEHALADRGLLAHEVADWVPRIIAGLAMEPVPLPV